MAIELLVLVVHDDADARAMSTARQRASRDRVVAAGCEGWIEMPRPVPASIRALARPTAQASRSSPESLA